MLHLTQFFLYCFDCARLFTLAPLATLLSVASSILRISFRVPYRVALLELIDVGLGRVTCEDVDYIGRLRLHLKGLFDLHVRGRLRKSSQILYLPDVLLTNKT